MTVTASDHNIGGRQLLVFLSALDEGFTSSSSSPLSPPPLLLLQVVCCCLQLILGSECGTYKTADCGITIHTVATPLGSAHREPISQ